MIARSLMIGVAGAALLATGAQAADLYIPETPAPIYEDAGFSFEGLYVGATGGVAFTGNGGGTTATTTSSSVFPTIGVVAGVNFAVADPIVAGIEFELDAIFNTPGGGTNNTIGNAAVRGHLGALVTDNVMVYALAGVGVLFNSSTGVAPIGGTTTTSSEGYGEIGVGVEFGVTESVSIRGEVAYLRSFNNTTVGTTTSGGRSAGRATAGILFHF